MLVPKVEDGVLPSGDFSVILAFQDWSGSFSSLIG